MVEKEKEGDKGGGKSKRAVRVDLDVEELGEEEEDLEEWACPSFFFIKGCFRRGLQSKIFKENKGTRKDRGEGDWDMGMEGETEDEGEGEDILVWFFFFLLVLLLVFALKLYGETIGLWVWFLCKLEREREDNSDKRIGRLGDGERGEGEREGEREEEEREREWTTNACKILFGMWVCRELTHSSVEREGWWIEWVQGGEREEGEREMEGEIGRIW
jgi:hypothetical protein